MTRRTANILIAAYVAVVFLVLLMWSGVCFYDLMGTLIISVVAAAAAEWPTKRG
jgi:hypothetical protein